MIEKTICPTKPIKRLIGRLTLWPLVILLNINIHASANDEIKLPELGDSTAGLMAPAQEHALGQAWLRSFRASVPLESDPLLYEYLENLLFELSSFSELKDLRLDLVLVKNPSINAFAVPGGVVGVNTGLLLHAQSEAQLVSVLTHELAHLSQRHFARGVEASKQANIASIAGLLAGIILAATAGGDAATAAIATSQAIAIDSQLRYSRLHEREADRIGMKTLIEAGYPPQAAAEMFKQMLNVSRLYGNKTPEFLLTHPVTESRISDAENRARQAIQRGDLANATASNPPPNTAGGNSRTESTIAKSHLPDDNSIDYLLMRSRAQTLSAQSTKSQVKQALKELDLVSLSTPSTQEVKQVLVHERRTHAARYALALAYNENNQWKKSRETLAPLLQQIPGKIAYSLLDIEIDIGAGKQKNAEKRLRDLNSLIPNNYAVSMMLANALQKNKDYQGAQAVLNSLVATRPNQADIWYLLAEINGLAGDILELHRARAEFFLLRGNFGQAKQHLLLARKLAGNNYQLIARVNQRAKEIQSIQAQTERL